MWFWCFMSHCSWFTCDYDIRLSLSSEYMSLKTESVMNLLVESASCIGSFFSSLDLKFYSFSYKPTILCIYFSALILGFMSSRTSISFCVISYFSLKLLSLYLFLFVYLNIPRLLWSVCCSLLFFYHLVP